MRCWAGLCGLMLGLCLPAAAHAQTTAGRWLDNYDQADQRTRSFHHIQILGTYAGIAWVVASQKGDAAICVPGQLVLEQGQLVSLLRNFVTRTDRSFADKPFGYALFAALRFTFPCKRS